MNTTRRFADAGQLTGIVQQAFGSDRRIVETRRLPNGSKKGVYRLRLDDATRAIVYVWAQNEDYWHDVLPESTGDPSDPFSHASGPDQFEAASRRLQALGVRSPRLLLTDRSRALFPGDVAVVEDVAGGTLEDLLDRDPEAGATCLEILAESLRTMHNHRSPALGTVAAVDAGGRATAASCEQAVLDRALTQVAEIADRDQRAEAGRALLTDALLALAAEIGPRSDFGLIHGELGPDHVLVDPDGAPVLIDIEGLKYFDVEWEHVFVRMRFDRHYDRLRRDDLDEHRMRLYQLAMHVDLVAGPLRIADSDHPERQWFLELAEFHLQAALSNATQQGSRS